MRIFVGSSSSEEINNKYTKDCKELLEEILKENDLVFGASNKGLMGLSYRIAKKNHRKIIGMCPKIYEKSLEEIECDEEIVTTSIVDSTIKLIKNTDVILFLPGGFGTLYELISSNYCKICEETKVPVIIYNSNGYYNKLLDFIEEAHKNKFIKDKDLGKYTVCNKKEEVIALLKEI